jgi:hypothetical protein
MTASISIFNNTGVTVNIQGLENSVTLLTENSHDFYEPKVFVTLPAYPQIGFIVFATGSEIDVTVASLSQSSNCLENSSLLNPDIDFQNLCEYISTPVTYGWEPGTNIVRFILNNQYPSSPNQ